MIEFLLKRTHSERRLLAVLGLVVVPLAIAFGVLLPLHDAKKAAKEAEARTAALHIWVATRAVDAAALGPVTDTTTPKAPIGSSGIEERLIDAGLRPFISDLGVRDEGVIELRFDTVTFTQLANWLSDNETDWGYDLTSFRFEALDAPGKVSASLVLTPSDA
ncbi:type II secretion system protein GspM [Ascidiaceihabitans sp.]|uniref:type II secretion system protein GspM n=1 Tax=Ascidiaceihabitans sp. TaxID=1872644 RepID=UPI0032998394